MFSSLSSYHTQFIVCLYLGVMCGITRMLLSRSFQRYTLIRQLRKVDSVLGFHELTPAALPPTDARRWDRGRLVREWLSGPGGPWNRRTGVHQFLLLPLHCVWATALGQPVFSFCRSEGMSG